MGEIRIVGPGKTRGYYYPACKKRIASPGETRRYPYPVCKKEHGLCTCTERLSTVQAHKPCILSHLYNDI